MISERIDDQSINQLINRANVILSEVPISYFSPSTNVGSTLCTTGSLAASNLVIVELLARLLEKEGHECNCNKTSPSPEPNSLSSEIIRLLDLYDKLLEEACEGSTDMKYRHDGDFAILNLLSYQVRKELSR